MKHKILNNGINFIAEISQVELKSMVMILDEVWLISWNLFDFSSKRVFIDHIQLMEILNSFHTYLSRGEHWHIRLKI